MVLRGSNTRPETPLLELRQDLISTAEELKQQNTELHDKSLKLKSLVEELLEGELPRRLQIKKKPERSFPRFNASN